MAAYKKDINLFKAAGGERAKSKKMAATKKLIFVGVVVLILVAGAIAALMYFNKKYDAELEALQTQSDNYERTAGSTRSSLAEYHELQDQAKAATLIEYQSMLQAGFSTDLSRDELQHVRDFLSIESTGYTIDNRFDDVVDDVLDQLNLMQYDENIQAEEVYKAKFLYGALSFMKTMEPVFTDLPLQVVEDDEDTYYWYCYYRGKFVMMLRSTGGTESALATSLQTEATLGCSPFCSLKPAVGSTVSSDYSIYTTVTLTEEENTSYTIIAITCKTVPERFLDCVEDVFTQNDSPVVDYNYNVQDYAFAQEDATFSLQFYMTQSVEFRLVNVCDAVVASPFFKSYNFGYSVTDSSDGITCDIRFTVNNEAVNATLDGAIGYFAIVVEESGAAQEE